MAKLHEEIIVVKISKLLKDAEAPDSIMSDEAVTSLEAVIQELAGQNVLVEIATE